MARIHHCYKHDDRPVVAYCDQCARPCCRSCVLEVFDQYLCERCKQNAVDSVNRAEVQQDALRAVVMGAVGIFVLGFALGPYAIWRASTASKILDASPWLRGRWHVRAAYVLGALATAQGLITLGGRYLLNAGS